MEIYTSIDENSILITTTTPLNDSDGNPVLDSDGNQLNSVTNEILTLDQANQNLTKDTEQLNYNTAATAAFTQNTVDSQAKVDLDNARIAAFSMPIDTKKPIQIRRPIKP